MEHIVAVVKFIAEHHQDIIEALLLIATGLVALALMIPGDQPEKTLKKIVAILEKLSRKPRAEEPVEAPKAETQE